MGKSEKGIEAVRAVSQSIYLVFITLESLHATEVCSLCPKNGKGGWEAE